MGMEIRWEQKVILLPAAVLPHRYITVILMPATAVPDVEEVFHIRHHLLIGNAVTLFTVMHMAVTGKILMRCTPPDVGIVTARKNLIQNVIPVALPIPVLPAAGL